MKKGRLSPYYLLLCLPVLLALVGLIWGRPSGGWKAEFDLDDLNGRYVTVGSVYDLSTVHPAPAPASNLVGPPVFDAMTAVLEADGNGNVCGEQDGFFGNSTPGTNGNAYIHGTYSIDANGRITINYCADTGFCTKAPPACVTNGTQPYRTLVGYLQSPNGSTFTTIDQINNSDASKGGCCATSGYLVRARVWSKDRSEQNQQ